MDDDRADEPERVRLPGFGQPAAHMRPDDARYQPDYGPQPRYSQHGYARERGIGSARRASTWTAAALIAGVAATTGYLAHAIPVSGGSASTSAGTGHANHAGKSAAVAPSGPAVSGPVATSGGSGAAGRAGGGGDN